MIEKKNQCESRFEPSAPPKLGAACVLGRSRAEEVHKSGAASQNRAHNRKHRDDGGGGGGHAVAAGLCGKGRGHVEGTW